MRQPLFRLLTKASFCLFAAATVPAQQTIFNVPTADVLDAGQVYVELDASLKADHGRDVERFYSLVPRLVVGVGNNIEAGLNVTGQVEPGKDATTLVPTVKWRFFQTERKDLALFAGNNFYIPVRNRAFHFGSYSYVSGAVTKGRTRLTAGGYVASKGVFAQNAVRAGGQFGIERQLNEKTTIAADWITGRHTSGYFTPGLIFKPRKRITTYLSYSIGNGGARHGNHFFLFEIGYNFN